MTIDKPQGASAPANPPRLTLSPEALRRRRLKNWALLLVLAAFSLLFYLITIVRMGNHG